MWQETKKIMMALDAHSIRPLPKKSEDPAPESTPSMHFLYLQKKLHEYMWMQEKQVYIVPYANIALDSLAKINTSHFRQGRGDAPAQIDMVDEQLEYEDIEL
ncbi:hypothetical protein AVEN_192824-1 [Araneus ventricosus]|uniref:Uncharacterized protein n=1 Tax=Araneus ventricosus TaxID=182803 RepID=A0A4Y2WAP1_ARAVE|nr:hypothetical protein AVEN_192824-1 [Araneus ventricosus]